MTNTACVRVHRVNRGRPRKSHHNHLRGHHITTSASPRRAHNIVNIVASTPSQHTNLLWPTTTRVACLSLAHHNSGLRAVCLAYHNTWLRVVRLTQHKLMIACRILGLPQLRVACRILGLPQLRVACRILGLPQLRVACRILGQPQLRVACRILGLPQLRVACRIGGSPQNEVVSLTHCNPPWPTHCNHSCYLPTQLAAVCSFFERSTHSPRCVRHTPLPQKITLLDLLRSHGHGQRRSSRRWRAALLPTHSCVQRIT